MLCSSFSPTLELPPLLEFENGTKITDPSQWPARRAELKEALDVNILGTKPLHIPAITAWHKVNSTDLNFAISSYFSFSLNVSGSTPITFEMLCPHPSSTATSNSSKFPIVMTQYNHREWSVYTVQRRFCSLRTPTADNRDDSEQFAALFPEASWGKIPRRAWLVSRIIDFAVNVLSAEPEGVQLDVSKIGVFGHSRNGKQSLIAAAYDERIQAVVGSSSGTPIAAPFRLTARDFYGETCKSDRGRNWWTPRYQSWFGKENECPSDGHFVTALVAPRFVMLANAAMDNAGDINFADDKNYILNKGVFYELLNATKGALTMQHRAGSHHGFVSVSSYLDFFCFAFGREDGVSSDMVDAFISPLVLSGFSFDDWNATFSSSTNYTVPDDEEPLVPNKVSWLLGDDAVRIGGGYSSGSGYCEEAKANNNYLVQLLGQWKDWKPDIDAASVESMSFAFGGYINGDIFYPKERRNHSESLPVLVYVAGYNYNLGVVQTYALHEELDTDPFYFHFASQGFAVVTFHQIGFGERLFAGKHFYDRFGSLGQSRMGRMVRDVRALLDFVQCLSAEARLNASAFPQCQTGESYPADKPEEKELDKIPNLSLEDVTVVGYAVGGAVAVHAAAIDDRIASIASIAGFSPWRKNADHLPNSGNHYLYEYHALIPKLGLFAGNEGAVPYDYPDLFEAIAPRKVLIYAPQMDRNADWDAVRECITEIKPFWVDRNAQNNLTVITPNEVGNFCNEQYKAIEQWLQKD